MFFSTISSSNSGQAQILTDNSIVRSIKLSIDSSGKVGIGTTNPEAVLEICHSDDKGGMIINQNKADTGTSEIKFSTLGKGRFSLGYTESHNRTGFFIWNEIIPHSALFIDQDNKTGINTGWPTAQLEVNGDFKADAVGIGTSPPQLTDSCKLWVEGGIAAREIKVTSGYFPDFVFEPDYQLISLDSLQQFITEKKHLPNIPSQSDIKKDGGVRIGDLQVKLLQKIEEQSLYIISLQKQINELREEIKKGN
jgi:hypothetical protein